MAGTKWPWTSFTGGSVYPIGPYILENTLQFKMKDCSLVSGSKASSHVFFLRPVSSLTYRRNIQWYINDVMYSDAIGSTKVALHVHFIRWSNIKSMKFPKLEKNVYPRCLKMVEEAGGAGGRMQWKWCGRVEGWQGGVHHKPCLSHMLAISIEFASPCL